jgi:hypothetical protein
MSDKRILLIGRWSPFHIGHKTLVDSFLKIGKKVCIAIRETEEKFPVSQRMAMIRAVYCDPEQVKIITIPDIEGVAIGRDVGYYFVEVPEDIKVISGTKIRAGESMDVPDEVRPILQDFKYTPSSVLAKDENSHGTKHEEEDDWYMGGGSD